MLKEGTKIHAKIANISIRPYTKSNVSDEVMITTYPFLTLTDKTFPDTPLKFSYKGIFVIDEDHSYAFLCDLDVTYDAENASTSLSLVEVAKIAEFLKTKFSKGEVFSDILISTAMTVSDNGGKMNFDASEVKSIE